MQSSAPSNPQSIADACEGAFTERARRKGASLFAAGQATLEGMSPSMALLTIQHDRDAPFRVAIDVDELETRERLRVECQCASFAAGHPCEHVFAALLVLEAEGEGQRLFPVLHPQQRLDVVTHRTGLPLGEDSFFEGEHAFARVDANEAKSSLRADWRGRVETLRRSLVPAPAPTAGLLEDLQLVLDPNRSETAGAPVIIAYAPVNVKSQLEPVSLARRDLERVTKRELRVALEPWLACPPLGQRTGADALAPDPGHLSASTRRVPLGLQRTLLDALSGHLSFGLGGNALNLDKGALWQLELQVSDKSDGLFAEGILVRGDGIVRSLEEADLVLRDGWVVFDRHIAPFDPGPSFDWVRHLRREGPFVVQDQGPEDLLRMLASLPALPRLRFGGNVGGWTIAEAAPIPRLCIGEVDARSRRAPVSLGFSYDGLDIEHDRRDAALIDGNAQRVMLRDMVGERGWLRRLLTSGLEAQEDSSLSARASSIPEVELDLVELGASVQREGIRLRRAGASQLRLRSGIDWFEVDGEMDFGGESIELAQVLESLRTRGNRVQLQDGSEGIVPSSEVRRLRALAGLSHRRHGVLRFSRSQAILLDALVGSGPKVERDEPFTRLVEDLRGDLQITPASEPEGFGGQLRPYQRFGLGWLQVLRRLGLGGCLADDMGLGKTVQILALLGHAHQQIQKEDAVELPTLVVAPRSLVFNWKQEAQRFTPHLTVVEYTGQQRNLQVENLKDAHLILTTYGTLRRDVDLLSSLDFEYVILDEAQTIKNHSAQVSKASRQLRARHRLALSGTPVENDVSEVWSIFEFLNPKMLGARRDFVRMAQGDALSLVARGLAPLLLRRRKEDVLSELPEKTELTVYCDFQPEERRRYNALRAKFQKEIDKKAELAGTAALRTEVLEALLRLRQMSCHPGLIDERKKDSGSTKLDALVAHLSEVVAEGHKALVFSQFVQFLSIVRARLDRDGVRYAYLDGQVRDRETAVQQFQTDPECPVFLISLRAGGLGLNLTAADYVFILDPWWNPAVEAQAIDRAHRIGQTRPVFAYRYIVRDTVEEKMLDLHRDKRALAEAIVGGDQASGGKLSLDELRLLLK